MKQSKSYKLNFQLGGGASAAVAGRLLVPLSTKSSTFSFALCRRR